MNTSPTSAPTYSIVRTRIAASIAIVARHPVRSVPSRPTFARDCLLYPRWSHSTVSSHFLPHGATSPFQAHHCLISFAIYRIFSIWKQPPTLNVPVKVLSRTEKRFIFIVPLLSSIAVCRTIVWSLVARRVR